MEDVKNYAKNDVILGMMGNKCDLKGERAVQREEGELLAKKIGAIFYETSALENINVE
jgi:GTPase SAR1 family protein